MTTAYLSVAETLFAPAPSSPPALGVFNDIATGEGGCDAEDADTDDDATVQAYSEKLISVIRELGGLVSCLAARDSRRQGSFPRLPDARLVLNL